MILVIESDEIYRSLIVEIVKTFSSIPVLGAANIVEATVALTHNPQLIVVNYLNFVQIYPQIKDRRYVVISAVCRSGEGITKDNFIMKEKLVAELPKWLKSAK